MKGIQNKLTDYLPPTQSLEITPSTLVEAPDAPAVFFISAGDQSVYLAKTNVLRRRLSRVTKMWNLQNVRAEYYLTASRLEASLIHYYFARSLFPSDYAKRIKLRLPSFVKLVLTNPFPRTHITARLSGGQSLFYGPFRTRQTAEQFETRCLELFQLRRCQEDLIPRPDHPGCIYGEMNMCLRPCQQVVGEEEYRSEVVRVQEFLQGDGTAMLQTVRATRDRLSSEMDFEEAARQHKRLEKIQEILSQRDELAHELDRLNGVAVTRSTTPSAVNLWFLRRGWWQPPVIFELNALNRSLDRGLREVVDALTPSIGTPQERQEHLAILAAWRYSSFQDGEWLFFEDFERPPYRKLVNAIARQSYPANS